MAAKITTAKLKIAESTKRNWLRIKTAGTRNIIAFNNSISMLNQKETEDMYNLSKAAAYNTEYARLIFQYPALREIIKGQNDVQTLNAIYQALSFKLNRYEKAPVATKIFTGFTSRIGRFGQK